MQNWFSRLSTQSHTLMQEGKWAELIPCLNEMAGILHRENRYVDELKMYMLMFNIIIDFGVVKHIDVLQSMKKADESSGLSLDEKRKMFCEVAIEGLHDNASADEKFSIFELCINDKIDEASVLIHNRLVQ